MRTLSRAKKLLAGAVALAGLCQFAHAAAPLKDITFLLPAPAGLPAFAPYTLADSKGYYAKEGLHVRWVTVGGGVDAGKELAAGNGDLGDALGDTPIILRGNHVPVKGVALIGGHPLHQLITRDDRHINSPADLKGKTLSVLSYQDTSYFVALGMLGSAHLDKSAVAIHAGGPAAWQEVAEGKSDGIVGIPEWGANIEAAGVKVTYRPTDDFTPGMGQAIIASDKEIATDPDTVRKFVHATLHAMTDIEGDPQQAAKDFIAAVPAYAGKQAYITKVLTYYAKNVFPTKLTPGEFDPAVVGKVQDAYLQEKVIHSTQPVNTLFTNEFVK